MWNLDRIINLSASFCSLIAFVILIFEKSGVERLTIYRTIGYLFYSLYIVGIFCLFMYIILFLKRTLLLSKNLYKIGFGILLNLIILFFLIYMIKLGLFIVDITDSLLRADFS